MAQTALGVTPVRTGDTRAPFDPTITAVGGVAVALGICAVALVAMATPEGTRGDRAVLEALIIGVPVAVGWYAAQYAHSRRFGFLLIGAGCAWSLTALAESSHSVLYSIGRVSAWLMFPLLFYLMLAYPNGRIAPGLDRALYSGTTALVALLYAGSALFIEAYPTHTPWASCRADCPANAFLVLGSEPAVMSDVVQPLRELVAVVLVGAVTYSMGRRLRAATPLARRLAAPVVAMATLLIVVLVAFFVARRAAPDGDAATVLGWVWALCLPGIAAAFFVGLLRRRLLLGEMLAELSIALSHDPEPTQMRAALAATLDDPTLDLLVPDEVPGRWRDGNGGSSTRAAAADGGRALTLIHDDGEPVALLAHDPLLRADEELLAAVSALVLGSLEHRRATARLARSLEQLEESRKRIARAADLERARIERDLHDGAQQRLVMMRIKLSLAEELTHEDPEAGAAVMHEVGTEVDLALEELRALAHGVYPSVLSDRGLEDALRSIVAESPLTIHLEARGVERHPAEIETAVYFLCLEAIQNVIKHADGATGAWIRLMDPGLIYVEVRDDGPGFTPAGPSTNGGLGNMRDRVEAVGGRLVIDAAPGQGTRIVGVIPLP